MPAGFAKLDALVWRSDDVHDLPAALATWDVRRWNCVYLAFAVVRRRGYASAVPGTVSHNDISSHLINFYDTQRSTVVPAEIVLSVFIDY